MLLIDVEKAYIKTFHISSGEEKKVAKKTFFCGLQEVVKEFIKINNHHLLLPESAYLFHTIHMEYASQKPFTISTYKQLLQQKKELLVAEYGCDPEHMYLLPSLGDVVGDGAIKYLLGKSGKVVWTWYMYALSPEMLLVLRQIYGGLLGSVVLSPKHLSLFRFFCQLLDRSSFTLVTLSDQIASLCHIQQGWYEQFSTASLGMRVLLEATHDQGVQKYLFRDYHDLSRNAIAQKLLMDSLGFYSSVVADWIGGFLTPGLPLVICCPLFSHTLFAEVMQSALQIKGAFVLPFASLPNREGKKLFSSTDFSVSTYLYLLGNE